VKPSGMERRNIKDKIYELVMNNSKNIGDVYRGMNIREVINLEVT
jgi:hypothetical protein